MSELIKILTIGAEGGGLNIYGRQVDGKWFFKLIMDDSTPQLLLDEDPVHSESKWFSSLRKCMATCIYPWNCLYPLYVRPDFAQEIYKLKLSKDKKDGKNEYVTNKWMAACGLSPEE